MCEKPVKVKRKGENIRKWIDKTMEDGLQLHSKLEKEQVFYNMRRKALSICRIHIIELVIVSKIAI
ncbi:MAG TPA: hypothetical protein VEP90_18340 [Methylomirabilota bacterium]|nr:hypothetical protein [Methylomirabilota bacterium]